MLLRSNHHHVTFKRREWLPQDIWMLFHQHPDNTAQSPHQGLRPSSETTQELWKILGWEDGIAIVHPKGCEMCTMYALHLCDNPFILTKTITTFQRSPHDLPLHQRTIARIQECPHPIPICYMLQHPSLMPLHQLPHCICILT